MTNNKKTVEDRIAQVECPECNKMVHAYRTKGGRLMGATSATAVLGGLGLAAGASIGIVSGGTGTAATYYLGGGLAALGGGYGYIAGSLADQPRCPNCDETIDLGI